MNARKVQNLIKTQRYQDLIDALHSCEFDYPSETADFIGTVFSLLPAHQWDCEKTAIFVQIGMDSFVRHHRQYGQTHISSWWDCYHDILPANLSQKKLETDVNGKVHLVEGLDLKPYYAQIYQLLFDCCRYDEVSEVDTVVDLAIQHLGAEHPLVAKLKKWAKECRR